MLNPYSLLTPVLLDAMIKQPLFFVRQSYQRGSKETDPGKIALLFSHYSQVGIDKERAFRHFELIKNDQTRYLYDTTQKKDIENLKKASLQPLPYKIYTNVLLKKWSPSTEIRNKVGQYLKERFSMDLRLYSNSVKIDLQDLFGALYVRISWRGTKLEVLLDEVENVCENVL